MWKKEKLLVMSNFSFSQSVFKRLVLQTRKNLGLFGKGLNPITPRHTKQSWFRQPFSREKGENTGNQHCLMEGKN